MNRTVQDMCNKNCLQLPPLEYDFPFPCGMRLSKEHDFSGKHSFIQPSFIEVHAVLTNYLRCKELDPSNTSAIIAIPRWHRKKKWHSKLANMKYMHTIEKGNCDCLPAIVTDCSGNRSNYLPWSYDFYFDPPQSPVSYNNLEHSGDTLLMTSSGAVAGHKAKFLIDSGASHNFIDESFVQKYNLKVQDAKQEVLCGENASVGIIGHTTATVQVQSYKAQVQFFVMPLPKSGFKIVLGQSWLIRHATKIDYSHEQVLVEHNNITHVLSCGAHKDMGNPVLNAIEFQQHLREEDSMFFYGIMTDIEDEMMIDLNGAAVESASDR